MRTRAPLIAILGAALLLTACGKTALVGSKSADEAVGKGSITLTEKDNGKTFSVKVGATIAVVLEENVTTGHSWAILDKGSSSILTLVSNEYKEPTEASPPLVGEAGQRYVTFKAVGVGRTTFKLEYRQPWDKKAPAASTFTATIVVS